MNENRNRYGIDSENDSYPVRKKAKKRKKSKSNSYLFAICIILAVITALSVALTALFYVKLSNSSDEGRYNELYESYTKANEEKAALLKELEKLKKEIEELSDSDRLKSLENELEAANSELEKKNGEIEELKKQLEVYEKNANIDLEAQKELVEKLNNLLENEAPKRKVENANEDGNKSYTYEDAKISVYFEDIETGYTYSFGSDTVIRSASCIKAPLALGIFLDKSAEQSLGNIYTYTEKDYNSGTGKIKAMDYGTELTNYELIKYMIMYSDCVAYKQLVKEYGAGKVLSVATSVGAQSIKKDVGAATAPDAGKVMKAIYSYIESGGTHSADFKSWLLNSSYTKIIPDVLKGRSVAHKYGWDTGSYNDWAIVYDEHPYIITVMTNYDLGGAEVNSFLNKAVKLIDELHANLYKIS